MQEILGTASLLTATIGFAPYIADILNHKTKPHAFSWLVWAVLAGIAFGVQVTHEGGPGAWLMALTVIATLTIFLLSFRYGEKNILFVDWISLLLAGIALLLWLITDNPLMSVILISFIDVVGGFFPTMRKSLTNPYQETTVMYALFGCSLILSLMALSSRSLENIIYPASLVVANCGMVALLLIRRMQVPRQA